MKNLLLVIVLPVLASCDRSPQSDDRQAILRLINETIADVEVCLNDQAFHFPDVIVGPKYSGKGLAQLDALVSAGLLNETEEVLSEPTNAPKYIYHYKRNHLIERKTFYLTDQGSKYYRMAQKNGYFCYGRPENVRLEALDSDKNAQGDLLLNVTFSYDVAVNPDAAWISKPWVQREFFQNSEATKQKAQQQFIKDNQNAIKPASSGLLSQHYG